MYILSLMLIQICSVFLAPLLVYMSMYVQYGIVSVLSDRSYMCLHVHTGLSSPCLCSCVSCIYMLASECAVLYEFCRCVLLL